MKDNEKLLALMLLAGGAWWYYTRVNRLTLTGQPENPMLPPSYGSVIKSPLSPVQSSNSTSTAATNVVSGIANSIAQLWGRTVSKGPGNAPQIPSATRTGITAIDAGRPASGFTTLPIAPSALNDVIPYWMVDTNFNVPAENDVSALLWSAPPELSYLAPPPESAS